MVLLTILAVIQTFDFLDESKMHDPLNEKASADFSNIYGYLTTCIHGENILTNESTLAIYHLYQKKVVRANSVRACSARDLIV